MTLMPTFRSNFLKYHKVATTIEKLVNQAQGLPLNSKEAINLHEIGETFENGGHVATTVPVLLLHTLPDTAERLEFWKQHHRTILDKLGYDDSD